YRQLRYERQRLKILLAHLGLSDWIPTLIDDHKAKWGEKHLSFYSFDRYFATFPWQLAAQSFYHTTPTNKWMTLKSWLQNFEDTYVFQWYLAQLAHYHRLSRDDVPLSEPVPVYQRRRPFGMIFLLDGIKGGLIIHN